MFKFTKRPPNSDNLVEKALKIHSAIQAQVLPLIIAREAGLNQIIQLSYTRQYIFGALLVPLPPVKTEKDKVFKKAAHHGFYTKTLKEVFQIENGITLREFYELCALCEKDSDAPHINDGIIDAQLCLRGVPPQRLLLRLMDIFMGAI